MAQEKKKKALALIDGYHYLHTVRAALKHAEEGMGYSIVAAVLLGGAGKLGSADSLTELEIPVVANSGDFADTVGEACRKFEPEAVLDLSGEPLLDLQTRMRIASAVLARGASYVGPDFQFAPPAQPDLPAAPTLAVLGAGKGVGKTAVCAFAASKLAASGIHPVIVTMGRGGPATPLLLRGELTPEFLMAEVKQGRHAASDCYEEALLTGLPTIGCFRAGGGLAGSPFYTTVHKGAEIANSLECDIQIYEGSGNTAPPVRLDARLLVVGTSQPLPSPDEPFGPCPVSAADVIVVTGCEEPLATSGQVSQLVGTLRSLNPEAAIRTVVLRPQPLSDVKGKKVALAMTAPQGILETLISHIEQAHECEIVGVTRALSDRGRLKVEITSLLGAPDKPEVLLTELKAASVQVALPAAAEAGVQVGFLRNVPKAVEPEPGSLEQDVIALGKLAVERYRAKHPAETER
jgi:cyclic 2,3-diphosphoglycerate synthetase